MQAWRRRRQQQRPHTTGQARRVAACDPASPLAFDRSHLRLHHHVQRAGQRGAGRLRQPVARRRRAQLLQQLRQRAVALAVARRRHGPVPKLRQPPGVHQCSKVLAHHAAADREAGGAGRLLALAAGLAPQAALLHDLRGQR